MPPTEPKFPNPPLDDIRPGTLLTVAQAAAHFGVQPGTIRQWAHRGKITHVPLPGNGPRLYHLRPLAQAERDAWENGANRTKRGGRHPDFKPCAWSGSGPTTPTRPRGTRMSDAEQDYPAWRADQHQRAQTHAYAWADRATNEYGQAVRHEDDARERQQYDSGWQRDRAAESRTLAQIHGVRSTEALKLATMWADVARALAP